MSCILSIGKSIPPFEMDQKEVSSLVEQLFPLTDREKERYMPIFDNSLIKKRQFVVNPSWFLKNHGLKERNDIYIDHAVNHGLTAIDHCLNNEVFLDSPVQYNDIDMIIFVSTTGMATPSIEARIMNHRDFREDVRRMPLFGLGCAGGVSGMARAHEWLKAHDESCVLVVNVELCGLTFQKTDSKKSNFVGTALFGDGISATLLCGQSSRHFAKKRRTAPVITDTGSKTKKDSISVMGWDVTDQGFEVIFNKSIPHLVKSFWKEHIEQFTALQDIKSEALPFLVAHPGGKKVLEAYEEVLKIKKDKLQHSYGVLEDHGNMSSVTVCYVLERYMKGFPDKGTISLMGALGPGFSSELISLEWV
ncbi:type III polyketide synthase [Thalassobacillus pellis]|uniref:type III polyketide synthase n=1 Tax=Thalassobacillus pellis TaxID=748008 RepID=UPI0019607FF6|nr:type III polyketide synthase [Thalassobacillus pellis]MBM7552516.1 alkylresorcinol/alkylpyrone synthase [Thalassobacillus pellis]